MIFNTFEFLWLFPVIFALYWIVARGEKDKLYPRVGNLLLVIISYGLYIKYNPVYVLVLLGVTVISYFAGLSIEHNRKKKTKIVLTVGVVAVTLPLVIFKYYNFLTTVLTDILDSVGGEYGLPGLNFVMPLGISFFTFISIGYVMDVYREKIKAEHNWWDFMLFVGFFPQIASGPISKASDLLPQIKTVRKFNYAQAVSGCKWLLWGMFLKVVVADNIGLQVDIVYASYQTYGGLDCLLTMFLYSIQLYGDFAGYSFMAMGVGKLLGFDLINNFRQPYFSTSITEFWGRWHISLSTWLKDYVYISMGGNRCPKFRNYFNIMVTFLVSGLWHGANYTFLVWGGLHGLVQVCEKAFGFNKPQGKVSVFRIAVTFIMVSALWVFFRSPSLEIAITMFTKMFTDTSYTLRGLNFVYLCLIVVFMKDLGDAFNIKWLQPHTSKYVIVRWFSYLLLMLMIAASGVFGGSFIYSGF